MKASGSNVEWLHIGRLRYVCILAGDVLMYTSGCCIRFINLITDEKHLMMANKHSLNGDGIRATRGHRSVHTFAYAENSRQSTLYVKDYPSFKTIAAFKDGPTEGYTNMTFSETSLLIAIGDVPNFDIIIWDWRRKEKLGELKSNLTVERQMIRCNWGSPVSVAQLGLCSDKLYLWDVFICCKTAVLAKHELKFQKGQFNLKQFNDCVWTEAGRLYLVDQDGCVYSVNTEFKLEEEIDVCIEGNIPTSISIYKSGLVVSGPNREIRHYVKNESWNCDWTLNFEVGIKQLINSRLDYLIGVTMEERIVKVTKEEVKAIKRSTYEFNDICPIYPSGDCVAALRQNKYLNIYSIYDGSDIASTKLNGKALVLAENPEYPYIGIGYDNGLLELMSIYNSQRPSVMASFLLSRNKIDNIKFFEQGRLIVAGCSYIGEYFVIEGRAGKQMKVVATINARRQIVDFMLVASKSCYRLFLIPVTLNRWAGNKIIRYCIIVKDTTQVKHFNFDRDEFHYHKLVPTRTSTRDRIFYGVPFNSRNIHLLETKRGDPMVTILSEIKTGHQMRNIGLLITNHYAVTWGYDGFVFARDNNFEECVGMALTHHRYYGGVKKAFIDPFGKYIISLGRDNNLVCSNIVANQVDEERKNSIIELQNSVKFNLMFKRPTFGFIPEERFQNKTWLEVQELLLLERDEEKCRIEKSDILEEFACIKSELADLITKNMEGPKNEVLDLKEFCIDTGLYTQQHKENKDKCKKTTTYLKALIVAQDKITQHMMENYWNKMDVVGKVILGIFVNTVVVRYTMLPTNLVKVERLYWLEELRRLEKFISMDASFKPWHKLPAQEILKSIKEPIFPIEGFNNMSIMKMLKRIEAKYHICEEEIQAVFGSIATHFLEPNPYHIKQREMCTFLQSDLQQLIAEFEVIRLKTLYNKFFDEVSNQKLRELAYIKERNVRLRQIISEFNYFSDYKVNLEIEDPELQQREVPEELIRVLDYEMTVTPYISPSQQAILDAKAAEEERIRLALLADDFKERALMAMMNGVLELRWEDELRKDVPVPKCMIEKDPEEFKEEDLKAVKEYEEKVVFLNSERERYKHLLENEFTRVRTQLRDVIRRFNSKVAECLEFKMNIDSSLNHENLKVNRIRWKQNLRCKLLEQEEHIHDNFAETGEMIEDLLLTISSLTEDLNNYRTETMDAYQNKEKALDKAFRKDIQDMSPVVQEQAVKLYRRRPKTVFNYKLRSSAVDNELARCVSTHERSLILTDDCIEFLRALDQMDQFVDLPAIIDENTHNIICKHRRLRIEFELLIKGYNRQVANGESTIAAYQKRLAMNKEKDARLQTELVQVRTDYQYLMHNIQVQVVLRRGLVEIPLTGSVTDFDDAILIPRKEIEDINQLIREAGDKKIRTILRNMAYRRDIIATEWEHKRLRMQINDLIEQINDIDNVKVTKDMQCFLKLKAEGRKDQDTVESELERTAKSYESRISKRREKYTKVKRDILSYAEHNSALDMAIRNVHIDVCDLQYQKDDKLKQKQNEVLQSRMAALIKRCKLVRQIQNNHNEILILQTELELLRLKTYPTFKYKLIAN